MHFTKRAFLSIVRRPGKNLILLLVVFALGSLAAGAVAVRQAVAESEEAAKQALGASVSLGRDTQALTGAWKRGIDFDEFIVKNLSAELVEELGRRPEVRSFDYSTNAFLAAPELRNWYPAWDTEALSYGPVADMAYFVLRGTRYAPVMPIEEGALALVEGRTFTEEEVAEGRPVALIPDVVAAENGLHAGDAVTLLNEVRDYSEVSSVKGYGREDGEVLASRDVVLEVIGVFSLDGGAGAAVADGLGRDALKERVAQAANEYYRTFYVPVSLAREEQEFALEAERKFAGQAPDDRGPSYTLLYLLHSADDLDSFEQAAQAALPEFYKVLSATTQFEEVAAPMKSIQRAMDTTVLATAAAALAVVSLVVVLSLRDRRREFGVYLSLGAHRPAVVAQVLVEVLVVALVALALALLVGSLASDALSQQVVEGRMAARQGIAYSGYGVEISGNHLGDDVGLLIGTLSAEDAVAGYRVGIDAPYVLTFLGLGMGVAALSCAVPLLYVLRLKPRRILM
ncbi:MAG: FtsX-like permease family protein [Coriobacteriales bacterium]|jgi:putative ABC transport system permease protein|nr:FtsX-like permease family protein [Coriobacteriales bacterium]